MYHNKKTFVNLPSVMISASQLVCSQTCLMVLGMLASMLLLVFSVYACCLFKGASLVCLMGSATVNTQRAIHILRCLVVVKSKLELCLSGRE